MTKDLNKVQVTGRLGADPEVRSTPQGHMMVTFRVASNRSWRGPDGEAHEETEWFRIVAWNRLADVCSKWLSKGARVYVEGRLQTRQWQDQDGQSRSLTEVIAGDLIILDRRNVSSADEEPPPTTRPVEPAPAPPTRQARNQPRSSASASAGPVTVLRLPRSRSAFPEEDLPF
jgi:single-strand DNA-binding protein